MGKGDQRTKRGKIARGTSGKSRPKKGGKAKAGGQAKAQGAARTGGGRG